jgi:pimeloyl-ACP methyl ester carboxylesterase
MSKYVLIPGAWLGGWAWEGVAKSLRAHGSEVVSVTLPGLGDRVAEASTETDIEGYVTDVVDQIVGQDLSDVILVGHSFGGAVAAGVADRIPDRLSTVVYVDSGPMPSGSSYMDLLEGPQVEFIRRIVDERGDGWLIPMPRSEEFGTDFQASLEGMGEAELDRMRKLATPQPLGTWTQPLERRRSEKTTGVPKVLIATSLPLALVEQLIASGHPWFAELSDPEWSFEELPTGHWPMFSRPEDLARLLLSVPAKVG